MNHDQKMEAEIAEIALLAMRRQQQAFRVDIRTLLAENTIRDSNSKDLQWFQTRTSRISSTELSSLEGASTDESRPKESGGA